MVWALKHADVPDAQSHLVLLGLADHASDEGKGAWPSVATLATYARCSVRTVQGRLRRLEEAGLIVRGEQGLVAHLRADRRPVVYDLMMNGVHVIHPADGVHGEVERGAQPGTNGVHAVADKPSLNRTEPTTPTVSRAPSAQTLVEEWIDHCPARPPGRVVGQVAKELGTMLNEGIAYETVRAGLALWHQKSLHPSALASVVHEVMNPRAAKGAPSRIAAGLAIADELDAKYGAGA